MIKSEYHILHIEDNPGDVFLIANSLEESHLNVKVSVQDRLEGAIEWLDKNDVDVVLVDLNLPDTHDLSAVTSLLERYPYLCLVVLTGNDNMDIGNQAVQKGAQDYLVKNDANGQLLYKTITYSYERHQLSNKIREREYQLKEIYDTVNSAIFKISVEGQDLFRYLMVNHEFAHRLGKNESDIIGKYVDEVLPVGVLKKVFARYNEAIRSRQAISWEMQMNTPTTGLLSGIVTITPHFEGDVCEYLIGSIQDLTEINKANKALRESESFLKSLFENSLNAVLVADDDGNYIAVNGGAEKLFGYTKDEFLRMKVTDLNVPEDYQTQSEYESFIEDGSKTGEFHFYNKNGEMKCALYHATRLRENFNVSALIDITERVKYQHEIRKLSLIAQETINGAMISDVNNKIIWCNNSLEKHTGYTAKELLGQSIGDLLQGPESDKKTIQVMHDAVVNQEPFEVEVLNYRKDGTPFWFRIQSQPLFNHRGEPEGYFALQTDITQQKLYEQEIRSTKERLDVAIESAVLGVIDWDLESGEVKVDGKYFEVIGWSRENYQPGKSNFLEKLVEDQDKEYMGNMLDQVLEGKVTRINETYRVKDQSGELRTLSMQATVSFDNDRPVRLVGVIQNITDRVNQDKLLMQATINAQEKERERISKDIHDGMQQTLVTAMLNLEPLKSRIEMSSLLESRFDKGIDYLNKAIKESREIAHQLLPRSIKDFGYSESVNSLLDGVSDQLAVEYYDNLNGDRFDDEIELNLFRITQEALNNIVKHSHASKVNVQLMQVEEHLILSIEDDGIGFDVERIMKNSSGLYYVQSRATALGGTAQIESIPGKGSHLLVNIPKKESHDKHFAS